MMDEDEINKQSFLVQPSTFFSWQCVSIQHRVGITTDLVIRDRFALFSLLRVLEVHVMGADPADSSVMSKYVRLRFNNIIAFEAWKKRQTLEILWKSAIQKTLHELKIASIYEL